MRLLPGSSDIQRGRVLRTSRATIDRRNVQGAQPRVRSFPDGVTAAGIISHSVYQVSTTRILGDLNLMNVVSPRRMSTWSRECVICQYSANAGSQALRPVYVDNRKKGLCSQGLMVCHRPARCHCNTHGRGGAISNNTPRPLEPSVGVIIGGRRPKCTALRTSWQLNAPRPLP